MSKNIDIQEDQEIDLKKKEGKKDNKIGIYAIKKVYHNLLDDTFIMEYSSKKNLYFLDITEVVKEINGGIKFGNYHIKKIDIIKNEDDSSKAILNILIEGQSKQPDTNLKMREIPIILEINKSKQYLVKPHNRDGIDYLCYKIAGNYFTMDKYDHLEALQKSLTIKRSENNINCEHIDNVHNSLFVRNCKNVENSEYVDVSENVIDSKHIEGCRFIEGSENVEFSDHVENSRYVQDSYYILNSDNIQKSVAIEDSVKIEKCAFIEKSNNIYKSIGLTGEENKQKQYRKVITSESVLRYFSSDDLELANRKLEDFILLRISSLKDVIKVGITENNDKGVESSITEEDFI